MRIFNKILLIVFTVLICADVVSAQVSFTAHAPKQVVQGNKFDVKFILRNADGTNFKEPKFEGVTKLYGPATSTSYSMQMINGKTTSNTSCEYSLTMLSAVRCCSLFILISNFAFLV